MKKISRRKFIISTAKGATSLGIIAGCNKRSIVGDDIRAPSTVKGLDGYVKYEPDGSKKAMLTWNEHDLTDITGAPSEKEILGYNVYGDNQKLNSALVSEITYTDENGPDNNGFEDNKTYSYYVTAVDQDGNESPAPSSEKRLELLVAPPSRIYKVTRADASSGLNINTDVIKTMLHAGVKALNNEADVGKAYEALFDELDLTTKIAIKINCLAGNGLCTHPEVVEAVIDGLCRMLNATYPKSNITVFDDRMESLMNNAGFPLKNDPGDYRVLSTYGETSKFGYKNWGETSHDISGSTQRLSKIVEDIDYIINVPVLKDHSNAGITFALKNFYGIVDYPGDMHTDSSQPVNTWCDPYVAGVYTLAAEKVKLIVGDTIFAAHKGGPSTAPTFILNTILVTTDPVALDMYALKLINDERIKKNMYEITTEQDAAYPNRADARHILTAGSKTYKLGIINKEIVEVQT